MDLAHPAQLVRTKENTFIVFRGVDHKIKTPWGSVMGLFEQYDPYQNSGVPLFNINCELIGTTDYILISMLLESAIHPMQCPTSMVLDSEHSWQDGDIVKGVRIISEFSSTPYLDCQRPCGKDVDGTWWYLQRIIVPFDYDEQANNPTPSFIKIDDNCRKILKIYTRIIKGEQFVGFKIEGLESDIYLSQQQVKLNTGVDINEVEILANSSIRTIFYQIDEIMKSGQVCDIANRIVKDFSIKASGTIDQMRGKYGNMIPELKQIIEVFPFKRDGRKIVGFKTNGISKVYISSTRLTALTLLKPNSFHILVGSFISPIYYKEGEILLDKQPCLKNNTILKELNLRYKDTKNNMRNEFNNKTNSNIHPTIEENAKGEYHEDGWHDEDELREKEMWDDAEREVDSWAEDWDEDWNEHWGLNY